MRKATFTAIGFLIALSCNSQHFEGKIVYSNTFLSADGQRDLTEEIIPYYGKEQHYYINQNNYKSTTEEGRLTQLYLGATNTYHIISADKKVQPLNAAIPSDPVKGVSYLDTIVTVLDYTCRLVKINNALNSTIYFFSNGFGVDQKTFQRHKFGNWAEYLKASRGQLPLKYISINSDYIHIAEAISIEPGKIEDDEFILPPDYWIDGEN